MPRSAVRAAILAALTPLAGCSAVLPDGATMQAREMHTVWVVFFWAAVGVAIIVWGLIAYCLIRWRERDPHAPPPPQFNANNRLEIAWTLVPLVIVLALFTYTYVAERHVETLVAHPDVNVIVTGFRWGWRFEYPQLGVDVRPRANQPPELVLPQGQTIAFDVESADVAHSFAVPDFLFKRDAIPGIDNRFDWTPTEVGVYRGECGEFCGLDHALMTFTVAVVTPAQFAAWVARHRNVAEHVRGAHT